MGVYVIGMEMPENCLECPCLREDDIDGMTARQCNVTFRTRIGRDARPDDCPLVEVATPHGRLIDEDDLFEDTVIEAEP